MLEHSCTLTCHSLGSGQCVYMYVHATHCCMEHSCTLTCHSLGSGQCVYMYVHATHCCMEHSCTLTCHSLGSGAAYCYMHTVTCTCTCTCMCSLLMNTHMPVGGVHGHMEIISKHYTIQILIRTHHTIFFVCMTLCVYMYMHNVWFIMHTLQLNFQKS